MRADRADWVAPGPGWPASVTALTTVRQPWAVRGHSQGPFGTWNLADHVDDAPAAVAANRAALLSATGVSGVQWLQQVHGTAVVAADGETARQVPVADAAWTRQPGLAVAVLTADCVPVVLADRAGTVVGVAHGGWRGLVGGVIGALVAAMPVPATGLVAWVGPAIGPAAYEVGDDVAGAVAGLDRNLADVCLRPGRRPGKHQLDLFALTASLLAASGVAVVPFERTCTFSDARFYSYRRDGVTGRMATLAWLQPAGDVRGKRTPCS
ncbi:MAG: peptidoglycan editing factor PgeF [Pseudomonadales bacterium]